MLDPFLWLMYLLTYSDTKRALLGSRRQRFGVMVWCKHWFQRRRSNFDEKFVHFQRLWTKKLIKEFLSKDWRLRGLNKLLKKLQETGTTARRSGSIESIRKISRFSTL